MILLDTSVVIEFLKGTEKSLRVTEFEAEVIAISPLTLREIIPFYSKKQEERFNILLEKVIFIPFDFECGLQAAHLKEDLIARGEGFEEIDLLLAATSLAHNAIFLTCDTDFIRMKIKNCVLL